MPDEERRELYSLRRDRGVDAFSEPKEVTNEMMRLKKENSKQSGGAKRKKKPADYDDE